MGDQCSPRSAAPKQQVMLTAFFITCRMIQTFRGDCSDRGACRPFFQVLSLLKPLAATSSRSARV